jgi:hypothetical protein
MVEVLTLIGVVRGLAHGGVRKLCGGTFFPPIPLSQSSLSMEMELLARGDSVACEGRRRTLKQPRYGEDPGVHAI